MVPAFEAYKIIWTLVNLIGIIGIAAGFILAVAAAWRQSVAQKRIAIAVYLRAIVMLCPAVSRTLLPGKQISGRLKYAG